MENLWSSYRWCIYCLSLFVYLCTVVAENESIQKLDLSWNHLRLSGGIAVAASVKVSQPLDCSLAFFLLFNDLL